MLRNKISKSRLTMTVSHSHLEERIAMFKSIQKSGRIAAVAIGLLAALSPLAAPPAALAGGTVPTPELEKSYSFKTSSDGSNISMGDDSKFGYLYDYDYDEDDGYNLKSVSLINFNDGSACPIAIPDKSLGSACLTSNNQLYWKDGNNLVVFSPDNQSQTAHPISSAKYAYTDVTISYDGNRAAVEHYDNESELKKIEIYDLKSDELIQTYQSDKDDSYCYYSNDMSRLYFLPYDTEKGIVSLRVFNCDTGSTELKTVNVKKDDRSSDIDYIVTSSNSDDIYLQSDTTLIKADRDGNMSVLFNDDDHAPEWLYSNPSAEFYVLYTKKGSNDLFEEDDGYYELKEEDANLSIYDLNGGEIISSIAFPFGDGSLNDISHDGGVLLGEYSDDHRPSACLVDAQTGAKSEFGSHWCDLSFMSGDRKILETYNDEDDPTTLHVNIYKSNIPHSLPEDVLYFVQTHLPFVIGGGVAIILIIGGAIVILCIRKKRTRTANGMAAATPKPQRKQRRRQKRAQQNAVVPTAPAMQAASAEPARFCRHCGAPLVPEAQFCPTCGQKVD